MDIIEDLIKEIAEISSHNFKKPLPLHEPDFKDTRADFYLQDCIKSGWVSSAGKWVDKFEEKLCEITKSKYAVAITNGTDALRLALFIMGIKANDEVLVPSLTFVGTVNAIAHLGAVPNFVDVERNQYCLCPEKLDAYLSSICKIKNSITCYDQ